jgi:hypothetical protein
MATQENYEQINTCLYELGFILKKIGVVEFSIAEERRDVMWNTGQEIDVKLLTSLCQTVTRLYEENK